MRLYGFREEFCVINGVNSFDVIFLLKSKTEKFEYSLLKKTIRKVPVFFNPGWVLKDKNYSIDLEYFKNDIGFKDDIMAYITSCNEYDIVFNEKFRVNSLAVNCLKHKARKVSNRPVWIFSGDSNLGKSYIASFMSNYKEIYETDSSCDLPEVITADVIVVGNKYKFNISDIEQRLLQPCDVRYVKFS